MSQTPSDPRPDERQRAKLLYWQGHPVAEVARLLALPYGTVDAWKRRDGWDDTPVIGRIEVSVECRLMVLVAKGDKTEADLKEIEQLGRVLERTARVERYQVTGKESDLNPARKGKKGKKEPKNALTEDQIQALRADFLGSLFEYQRVWWENRDQRTRNILKSRQIGATWYFAREAFVNALETGDNQIFLSASRNQAEIFRQYIVKWVMEVTGVELKGTPLILPNGAHIYFLATSSKTAQGYHGHVYLDEYAWISKFRQFKKVASGMATHKRWRKTFFSTPSVINHEAYGFWSGEEFNRGRSKEDRVEIEVSHAAVRDGRLCEDGQWRHLVTIRDAAAQGCDLFDIEELVREYADADFKNLFMGEWVDDSQSFFTFGELQAAGVDALEEWWDVKPYEQRPYAGPVWIGYDPSRTRDSACITVVAPPAPGSNRTRYRVLERIALKGSDFNAQSEAIRALTQRYSVQHMAVDCTGIGAGVYEMVKTWWPAVRAITYSVETKSRMVLKAKHLFARKLIEFDAGMTDIISAFLSIRKTMTTSGRQQTFAAGRSEETGHADVAWAIMHALDRVEFRDLDTDTPAPQGRTILEFFE
jgi:uncharacterized protein YjcR